MKRVDLVERGLSFDLFHAYINRVHEDCRHCKFIVRRYLHQSDRVDLLVFNNLIAPGNVPHD